MALAYFGLKGNEFGELRPSDFWCAVGVRLDEKSADRRHSAELARGAALRLWNLQVKKECRISEPALFWRMPWDEDPQQEEERKIKEIQSLSSRDRDNMAKRFLERLGNGR